MFISKIRFYDKNLLHHFQIWIKKLKISQKEWISLNIYLSEICKPFSIQMKTTAKNFGNNFRNGEVENEHREKRDSSKSSLQVLYQIHHTIHYPCYHMPPTFAFSRGDPIAGTLPLFFLYSDFVEIVCVWDVEMKLKFMISSLNSIPRRSTTLRRSLESSGP